MFLEVGLGCKSFGDVLPGQECRRHSHKRLGKGLLGGWDPVVDEPVQGRPSGPCRERKKAFCVWEKETRLGDVGRGFVAW